MTTLASSTARPRIASSIGQAYPAGCAGPWIIASAVALLALHAQVCDRACVQTLRRDLRTARFAPSVGAVVHSLEGGVDFLEHADETFRDGQQPSLVGRRLSAVGKALFELHLVRRSRLGIHP